MWFGRRLTTTEWLKIAAMDDKFVKLKNYIYELYYMKSIYFVLFSMFLSLSGCGQQKKDITLKDVRFTSIFGEDLTDKNHVYSLLGMGYFRTPKSKNSDSLISKWMADHPNARIIPVSTLVESHESQTYCLVVYKQDTLNCYLIKNGCFPGGTMERPQTFKELSKKQKDIYGDEYKIIVHISSDAYALYINQIKHAEEYAKINKLGVWQKVQEFEE